MASAWADGATVTFRVPDPGGRLAGVRLGQDVRIPGDQLDFRQVTETEAWELSIGQPPVHRMEYLLELRHRGGGAETVTDPGNPRQVDGAFGPKSVLEFAAYRPPGWLTAAIDPGRRAAFEVPASSLDAGAAVPVRTWAPADAGDDEVLPALDARLSTSVRIGMGTSLGGLAMLHAHCADPDAFAGLFLQSGSFFWPRFDEHESWFGYFGRIAEFVAGIHHGYLRGRPIPITLTCGVIEENLPNNRLVEQSLRKLGYPVELHELPDMHNYTAWRDGFDPQLTRLLRRVRE